MSAFNSENKWKDIGQDTIDLLKLDRYKGLKDSYNYEKSNIKSNSNIEDDEIPEHIENSNNNIEDDDEIPEKIENGDNGELPSKFNINYGDRIKRRLRQELKKGGKKNKTKKQKNKKKKKLTNKKIKRKNKTRRR